MLRKIIDLFLAAITSAVLLVGLTSRAGAATQRPRSAVRRIQAEQQLRDARIREQAERRRREHEERQRREWKLREERRQRRVYP